MKAEIGFVVAFDEGEGREVVTDRLSMTITPDSDNEWTLIRMWAKRTGYKVDSARCQLVFVEREPVK